MKKSLTTLLFALVAIMMPIGAWAQNAEITDVTVSVDGVTYGSGDTAVITPTTTSILFTQMFINECIGRPEPDPRSTGYPPNQY